MEKAFKKETESLCPVCLERVRATRVDEGDDCFLVKTCPEHGSFRTVIWRGPPLMAEWKRPKEPVHPEICYGTIEKGCPYDCGLCAVHEQLPCSVLVEVTDRCNLHCPICFADSGAGQIEEPSIEKISWLFERAMGAAGPSNLQLSGGEPTFRDDLPEIVELARRVGYSFVQVNTNGRRLASDENYVIRLKEAGLSSVFLQFDGVDDGIYRNLRGRPLLDEKLEAIDNCGRAGLGVVMVPTLVRGVNTDTIGVMVRKALELAPAVRGIHFQPVSYFGRFPEGSGDEGRFTLPELMRSLEEQTDGLLKVKDFSPPGCEHAHCSFHATYINSVEGLKPLGAAKSDGCCSGNIGGGGVRRTVETVSRRWTLPATTPFISAAPVFEANCCRSGSNRRVDRVEGIFDLDVFLQEMTARSFTISAMAFQDAENIDLERLRGCCISVVSSSGKLVPFCAYNLTSREGKSLYRRRNGLVPG